MSSSLDKRAILALFNQKSNIKASAAILRNWAAFLTSYFLAGKAFQVLPPSIAILVYLPLAFIIGCSLRAMDNLTHEASHSNLFIQRKLHKWFEFLYAFPVLRTVEDYWSTHKPHHKYFNKDLDQDPDTAQNIRWGIEGAQAYKGLKGIVHLYITRFFTFYYPWDSLKHAFVPHLKSKESVPQRLAFWSVILLVVALTNTWIFFIMGYVIPLFIVLPYIRFYVESSMHSHLNIRDIFGNSRNNLGYFNHLFLHPHKDGYHWLHHYLPSIPCYNLKRAYHYIKATYPDMNTSLVEAHSPIDTLDQMFFYEKAH